jgi:two-component system cell cycle response regulator DivK
VSMAERKAPRILVVEDDPDNRRLVVKVLGVDGYGTLEAADGESAVEVARREHPDAILMDLALPRMDGWAAARRLKGDPGTADIPIIALTAFAMLGDEERAREAGCDAYLPKPCRPQAIREVVARLVARRP